MSAFVLCSVLLSGPLGHGIDALDTNRIRATKPWRRAPEQASQTFDGRMLPEPTASMPQACQGWGETIAAYRFFDDERVQ